MAIESTQEKVIHNVHVHLFNIDYIPKYFLSRFLPVSFTKKKWLGNLALSFFRGSINRYLAFLYSGLKKSHAEIYDELAGYYPRDTIFVPLSVDFDFMGAGPCERDYMQQIQDLSALRKKRPARLFPFLGIDPRREGLLDLVKQYIEKENFVGLKMYPALGFFPDDERLFPIFEYAVKHNLPITSHCVPKNKNHFRTPITDEMKKKVEAEDFDRDQMKDYFKSNYDFAYYLNHPHWYTKVLNKFPTLKINLAHFGGNDEWDRFLDLSYIPKETERTRSKKASLTIHKLDLEKSWFRQIRDLIRDQRYPNVYSDISFTVHDHKLFPLLKNLLRTKETRDYVLFGSDFYMLQKDFRERRFGMDVRGYLDEDDFWQIADTNPRKFLESSFYPPRLSGIS